MKKYILPTVGISVVLIAIFIISGGIAHANPLQITETRGIVATTSSPGISLSLATSTVNSIPVGTATTTSAIDTQADGGLSPNSLSLQIQLTATTTTTVLGWRYEYSQGNSGNTDCSVNQTGC